MAKKTVAPTLEMVQISQRNAQRIVGDAEIAQAFEELKETYLAAWTLTKPIEGEKRELLYLGYKAVSDVWAVLQRKAQGARVRDLKDATEQPNG